MRIVQYNDNVNPNYEFRLIVGNRLFKNDKNVHSWSDAIVYNWIAVEFGL